MHRVLTLGTSGGRQQGAVDLEQDQVLLGAVARELQDAADELGAELEVDAELGGAVGQGATRVDVAQGRVREIGRELIVHVADVVVEGRVVLIVGRELRGADDGVHVQIEVADAPQLGQAVADDLADLTAIRGAGVVADVQAGSPFDQGAALAGAWIDGAEPGHVEALVDFAVAVVVEAVAADLGLVGRRVALDIGSVRGALEDAVAITTAGHGEGPEVMEEGIVRRHLSGVRARIGGQGGAGRDRRPGVGRRRGDGEDAHVGEHAVEEVGHVGVDEVVLPVVVVVPVDEDVGRGHDGAAVGLEITKHLLGAGGQGELSRVGVWRGVEDDDVDAVEVTRLEVQGRMGADVVQLVAAEGPGHGHVVEGVLHGLPILDVHGAVGEHQVGRWARELEDALAEEVLEDSHARVVVLEVARQRGSNEHGVAREHDGRCARRGRPGLDVFATAVTDNTELADREAVVDDSVGVVVEPIAELGGLQRSDREAARRCK